jgi:hypothetical protein
LAARVPNTLPVTARAIAYDTIHAKDIPRDVFSMPFNALVEIINEASVSIKGLKKICYRGVEKEWR